MKHSIKTGEIIYNTWGWEQTNIDYYQVIKTTESTITIRPIEGKIIPDYKGAMSGYKYPLVNQFKSTETFKKTPRITPYGTEIKFEYGAGRLLGNDKRMVCSWYA